MHRHTMAIAHLDALRAGQLQTVSGLSGLYLCDRGAFLLCTEPASDHSLALVDHQHLTRGALYQCNSNGTLPLPLLLRVAIAVHHLAGRSDRWHGGALLAAAKDRSAGERFHHGLYYSDEIRTHLCRGD